MRFDFAKLGRRLAEEQTAFAIRVFTQTPEENERDAQAWDAAHPEQTAQREAWRAREAIWEQARAEGRVERYYVPPKVDNWDDGPFRDNWGHFEERIVGTDWVRDFSPGLERRMTMGLSERPARMDPSTGLTRPGQVESQSPSGAYRAPRVNVSAPRPAMGGSGPELGMGRPGGPGFSAGGGPGVPTDLPVVAAPRGMRESGMTGPLMRSGNAPADFTPMPTASAEESRADIIGGVLETVRRSGGDPFDGR